MDGQLSIDDLALLHICIRGGRFAVRCPRCKASCKSEYATVDAVPFQVLADLWLTHDCPNPAPVEVGLSDRVRVDPSLPPHPEEDR